MIVDHFQINNNSMLVPFVKLATFTIKSFFSTLHLTYNMYFITYEKIIVAKVNFYLDRIPYLADPA